MNVKSIKNSGIASNGLVTRTEEAYQALREVIIRQELPPGTWLRRRAIASQLGMSPTPLVQAFQRLEHEGLVECVPQWGFRVRALRVRELEQIYLMRLALESIVFRALATRVPQIEEDLKNLRPLAERVDQEIEREIHGESAAKPGTSNPEDYQFHMALAQLSGMEMVIREIERLCLLSATIVVLEPNYSDPVPTHVELLDAILTGDSDVAERAIREVIDTDMRHVLESLGERFGDQPIIVGNDKDAK